MKRNVCSDRWIFMVYTNSPIRLYVEVIDICVCKNTNMIYRVMLGNDL